jgi:hypothetical protein
MAKTTPTVAASLAERVEVKLHVAPAGSPGQAEVLVSGVRIAYVSLGPDHPFTPLPVDYLKALGIEKVMPSEWKVIVAKAKEAAAALAKAAADEQTEIAQILAGEPL